MEPPEPSAVTLSDVAAQAGVSIATASRALSGKPRVSRETIARVQDVAQRLGYRVDPVARALRDGSTRLVGMVVPVIGIPFFAQLVDAIEEELNKVGFELLLADSHGFVDEEVRRLRVLGDRRVDGILVIPSDREASAYALRSAARTTAVVEVDRVTNGPVADFVGVDNETGIALILDHLKSQGVQTLGFAGSDDASSNGVERWDAFQRICRRERLEVSGQFRGEFSVASGVAAAETFLAAPMLPDAIVAGSDSIAVGVMSRLREQGVRVPDDVLITGFDGSELASVVWPTLTTIIQPIQSIAADAVTFLVSRIEGNVGPFRRSKLTPSLQVGGSTAKSVSRTTAPSLEHGASPRRSGVDPLRWTP